MFHLGYISHMSIFAIVIAIALVTQLRLLLQMYRICIMFQSNMAKKSAIIRRIDLRATMKMMARGSEVSIPRGEFTRQAILQAVKAFNKEAGWLEYSMEFDMDAAGNRFYRIERKLERE